MIRQKSEKLVIQVGPVKNNRIKGQDWFDFCRSHDFSLRFSREKRRLPSRAAVDY